MVGNMVRAAVALGLLDEATPETTEGPTGLRQYILSPPTQDWEREERRAVMYYLISVDAMFSASGGWAGAVPLEEVVSYHQIHRLHQYCQLPTSKPDFRLGVSPRVDPAER
jgi:hypothetical protein